VPQLGFQILQDFSSIEWVLLKKKKKKKTQPAKSNNREMWLSNCRGGKKIQVLMDSNTEE
jgi:hypothetical protein